MDHPVKQPRRFEGTVISNAMEKTCVVRVNRTRVHPKYGKAYRVKRNFQVHDPSNSAQVGAIVQFEECRPISKEKRWRLV